ncbi:hypothetical protein N8921_01355 [Candidatus Pelagibacter sp.]|nr:hypothetical protein [Candidatus Pelagibacter sp.]
MGKVAKDKWDKVIEYLTHSDSNLEKVLSLLKGCDQGNASNYDVNRASYSLNIIAIVTQKQLDPENKDKTLTHIIRQWVKSKDFIQFYNLMRKQENITWDKSKLEDYTKQLKTLKKAIIIPLGNTVSSTIEYLKDKYDLKLTCFLAGFPHPSGANARKNIQFKKNKKNMQLILRNK